MSWLSQSRAIQSQLKKNNKSKTEIYSKMKLKYSPSILKHNKG